MRERLVAEQQVEERLTTWFRLQNNARLDSLIYLYHQVPELTVVRPDGRRTQGWDEELQAIRDFYGTIRYMNFVLQERETEVWSRDVAITTFRHSTDIVQADGRRRPVAVGTGTIVWVRDPQDKLWKIHTQQIAVNTSSAN